MYRDLRTQAKLHIPFHRNKDFSSFVTQYYDEGILGEESREQFTRGVHIIASKFDAFDQDDAVSRLESDLIPVLLRMEHHGVYIDTKALEDLGKDLAREIDALKASIFADIQPFNLNSSAQLQVFLFEKKGITPIKKTKTGWSTDEETLKVLAKDHPICSDILSYRHLAKLQSTYVSGLLKSVDKRTGRIHTTYDPMGAATGRMSSDSPNLQNIPSGDEWSDRVKSCFCPLEDDFEYMVADYSQVELRILAQMSGDEQLKGVFSNGEDVHERTARALFPDEEKISSKQRSRAKGVNFGVIYGITGFGLSKMMLVTPKEGKEYIDAFYETYPEVRTYYDGLLEQGRKDTYVETFFGRRRWLPGLNDANSMMRQSAEREAINMPIQGTSADIIKFAMLAIDRAFREKNLRSTMIMQVHDELVFEVAKDEREEVTQIVRSCMEGVVDWDVQLDVSIGIGSNWVEAK